MHQKQTMAFFTIAILAILIFITALCLSVYSYNGKKKELQYQLAENDKLREANLAIGHADKIIYTPNGKYIYALRRRNPDIGITKSLLYRTMLNPAKSKKISVDADDIIPSPSGKYLLLDSGMKDDNGLYAISIIDSTTYSKIATIRKKHPLYPYGWRGKDSSIWYSSEKNDSIYLVELKNKKERKIGTGFGFGWSKNGRFFTYAQLYSKDTSVSVESSSELFIYDDTKKTKKSILKEPSSKITNALFSHDNKTMYYTLTKDSTGTKGKPLKESQLKLVDLNKHNNRLLWSSKTDSKVPTEISTLGITGLTLSASGDELLFMARDWIGITSIDVKLNIAENTYDSITPGLSTVWDYNPVRNAIAWLDTSKHQIVEEKLD